MRLVLFLFLFIALPVFAAKQLPDLPDYDAVALTNAAKVKVFLKSGEWEDTWNSVRQMAENMGFRAVCYNFVDRSLIICRNEDLVPLNPDGWKKLREHLFVAKLEPVPIDPENPLDF